MKKSILFLCMLLPFCMISQNITSINPNQAMQGQTINLIISGNNMSFSGWSCWSNTGNLSDFRFSQWSGTNMLYGTPTNSVGQQLSGSLSVPPFQATGIYNLEVFDCLNAWWTQFPNSFEILAAAPASWDCVGNSCIDPGNGSGMYSSVAACNNACGVTPSWDCVGGTCFDPGNGSGMYSSLALCNTACVVTPSWNCIIGQGCYDPGTGNGTYASLFACQSSCITPTWNCTNNSCIDPGDGNGTFTTLASCQANCVIQPSWDCFPNANSQIWDCVDPGTGTGEYTVLSFCDAACSANAIDEEASDILIYPNPAKNTLTIDGNYISATIHDIFGKVVLTTYFHQKTINIAVLMNGIYFLHIKTKNSISIKKITINK